MHSRCEMIRFQPQQQFAYFGISTRTDISSFFFECLGSPRFQSPVFVIQKDSSVLHRRSFGQGGRGVNIKRLMLLRRNVGPPVPGRYSHHLRKREKPIRCPAPVTSRYHQRLADSGKWAGNGLNQITFPCSFQRRDI